MDNGDDADVDDEGKTPARKPRIRISLGSSSKNGQPSTKKKIKRRRRRNKETGELEDPPPSSDDEIATPTPSRKRRKPNSPEQSKASSAAGSDEDSIDDMPIKAMKAAESKKSKEKDKSGSENGSSAKEGSQEDESEEKSSIFTDVEHWKEEREKLDGSFMAARALFTKHGPWDLPEVNSERKFRLIAKSTLVKMSRHDGYSVFAEDVSDSEAPGYSDVISHPMNFSKMREKVESKAYGIGSEAFKKLYEDFLLVFDNCYAYNDAEGEVIQEAARVFGLLPESFATSAAAVLKK